MSGQIAQRKNIFFHLFIFLSLIGQMEFQESGSGSGSSSRKRIVQSIVDLLIIVIVFAAFVLVYLTFSPNERYFTCDMSDISYPYKGDTIPFYAVGLYATIPPLIFIVLVELLNAKLLPGMNSRRNLSVQERRRSFFICFFHAASLFLLGIAITLFVTEIGKRWVCLTNEWPSLILYAMPRRPFEHEVQ